MKRSCHCSRTNGKARWAAFGARSQETCPVKYAHNPSRKRSGLPEHRRPAWDASLRLTHRVCTCFRLTSIARKETTSVVITWRLQPDALPCHITFCSSPFTRVAAGAVCAAGGLRAKLAHHYDWWFAADANSPGCQRLLWHAGRFSDKRAATHYFAGSQFERNSGSVEPAKPRGWGR